MILKNIRHALRLALATVKVAMRHDVLLEKGVTLKYVEALRFGVHVTLQSGAYLYGSRSGNLVVVGDHVVIAAGSMVLGEGGVEIGAFTHLGPGVVVTSQYGDATMPMATPSPVLKTAPVRIGRGSWIGSRSVIMPGATLGERCVVAPGSVVYGRFADGATISGNPARAIRPLRARASIDLTN